MTVDVIGGSGREVACGEDLARRIIDERICHVVVLPIPTTRNGRDINGCEKSLSSLLPLAKAGVLFCGYNLPPVFVLEIEEMGGIAVDVSEDGIFTDENAALTAECTLSYIMSRSDRALRDLKVGIVGYGRIGGALLELLLFHGAEVKVFTRKESTRLKLVELGAEAELVADARLGALDVIVNTAPASLFSRSQCRDVGCEVLELAPGDNFPYVEKLTRLPSLPAKMLPVSSGRLYADAVVRALEKRGDVK